MENVRKKITKLFAIIAVAVAMLLCGVLLGCGEAKFEPSDNGDSSGITDTEKSNEDNGENGDNGDDDGDGILSVDLPISSPTGVHIRAKFEEKEEYDIDDISIELLYGIEIDKFHSYGFEYDQKDENEEMGKNDLCFVAYDKYKYYGEGGNLPFREMNPYYVLSELEEGEANDGAFMIERLPFKIAECPSKRNPEETFQYISVEDLRGTEYECMKNDDDEYVCYKKININLPSELFVNDSGCIIIDIVQLLQDYNPDGTRVSTVLRLSDIDSVVIFTYEKHDDKVVMSDKRLGASHVVDGTV